MALSATPLALPPLREDLKIQQGAPLASGAPSWTIYDPVRHRFFQIGQRAIEMIAYWSSGTGEALKRRLASERGVQLKTGDIENLVHFLKSNELTAGGERGSAHQLAAQKPTSLVSALMRRHIFFRVPLVRPQGFLHATLPLVRPLFSRGFIWASMLVLLVGLYLTSRLWSEVLEYAGALFSPAGIATYLVAIVFVKVLHELGHAYQAAFRGLSVPVMGVAFLVFLPLLYTDVTEAWRLRRRRDRVLVDAGGILAELTLAIYVTLIWCFLPDGAMRSAAFAIATTSWVFSLLINLNPLMRFDGYYLLSDAIGFPNLQNRGFRYGRWALRQTLFGLEDPPPEALSRGRAVFAISYAFATWIYRFVLFLGIALLVYSFVFKALGIILLIVELFFLILKPILNEIREWIAMSDRIVRSPKSWVSLGLVAGFVLLLFWPMSSRVSVPAVIEHSSQQLVFPPAPARLSELRVADGDQVELGAVLAVFEDPGLPFLISKEELRIAMFEARLLSGAGDEEERLDAGVTKRRLDEANERLAALRHLQSSLVVSAPISGRVAEVSRFLDPSNWLDRRHPLMRIVGNEGLSVRGLVEEADLSRIDTGREAVFVPDLLELDPFAVTSVQVSEIAVDQLPDGYFAVPNGGPIAVASTVEEGLYPQGMWYPVNATMSANEFGKIEKSARGLLVFRSKSESYASRIVRRVAQVIVRELSF